MAYGAGNWFHSRVSSSRHELTSIVKLVEASGRYVGLRWSGDKNSSKNIAFSKEINVNPSQMQTKIRAYIRFGFLKDIPICPLEWTRLGEVWRSLILDGGNTLSGSIDAVEELILASALSLYSFSSTGMSEDPASDYRPIPELLNTLDSNGFISQRDLKALIGEKNYTYWIADLQNSRFLKKVSGGFQSENRFSTLQNAIKTIILPTTLSETDWQRIKGDFLDTRNPYRDAILAELNTITAGVLNIESDLATSQRDIVSEMLDLTDADEISEIESGDYKVPDSYGKVKTRKKQAAWSKLVREAYNYQCAVPLCDINTPDFTVAAHIKKYALEENGTGHRANPYNGLCLCPLCHLLFDKGYFTLSDDLKIIISPKLSTITSSRLKDVITNSNNLRIKQPRKFLPKKEFIEYHRNNVFKR